ncbi:MAG: 2-hydroxyacid dehydrogenase [bacterium]|nr:2-hydroxyacid dehydrogenase [bacterium]
MRIALVPDEVRPIESTVEITSIDVGGGVDESVLREVGFFVLPDQSPPADLKLIARMPRLEVVQLLWAGYDEALKYIPKDVVLCNARGVHDTSTAEMALALMLTSLRGTDDFARAMNRGEWVHSRRESLADKRVVVIGAGGVGRAIHRRLVPFEVDVVLVGQTARPGVYGISSIRELLPHADVVVLALPLTAETDGLVSTAFLAEMPDGALLVNVARGAIVDSSALVAELAAGRLRAALDVTDPEPLPPRHPLWQAPGVVISPHVGGSSSAFLPRARRLVDEQLTTWGQGLPLLHVVHRDQ